MLYQPHYCDGNFNLNAKLTSLTKENLQGVVITSTKGKLDNRYLTKTYKFEHPMPKTTFALETTTKLKKTKALTNLKLNSTLANLTADQAVFDLKDATLTSDYRVDIASLEKLYFATNRHLRGGFKANGNITKNKHLQLSADSNIAHGDLHVELLDEKLHLNLNNMRTKKLLWILTYPEIFDGGIFAKVDYNLAAAKGVAKADFTQGVFVHNQPFDMLKQYAKVNLYKERFDGTAVANINKEHIASTFDLSSRKAKIKSDRTNLNTKTSTIDSRITFVVKNKPITATLQGKIAKPKVGVDLKEFLKSEAGKKLENKAKKEINKLFNKYF